MLLLSLTLILGDKIWVRVKYGSIEYIKVFTVKYSIVLSTSPRVLRVGLIDDMFLFELQTSGAAIFRDTDI